MLPTCLLLLVLILLGVICAHGFGCYSGLGTSTIVWTEVFWSSSDIIGRSERFGCDPVWCTQPE